MARKKYGLMPPKDMPPKEGMHKMPDGTMMSDKEMEGMHSTMSKPTKPARKKKAKK